MCDVLCFNCFVNCFQTSICSCIDQALAPSKDFYQLLVTANGVVWRRWSITPKAVTARVHASPDEQFCALEDFLEHDAFHQEIKSTLGVKVYEDAQAAIKARTAKK